MASDRQRPSSDSRPLTIGDIRVRHAGGKTQSRAVAGPPFAHGIPDVPRETVTRGTDTRTGDIPAEGARRLDRDGCPWSDADLARLKRLRPIMTTREIAWVLMRSHRAVRAKLCRLRVVLQRHHRTGLGGNPASQANPGAGRVA